MQARETRNCDTCSPSKISPLAGPSVNGIGSGAIVQLWAPHLGHPERLPISPVDIVQASALADVNDLRRRGLVFPRVPRVAQRVRRQLSQLVPNDAHHSNHVSIPHAHPSVRQRIPRDGGEGEEVKPIDVFFHGKHEVDVGRWIGGAAIDSADQPLDSPAGERFPARIERIRGLPRDGN